MKEVIIVFVIIAFSLYGFCQALKNVFKKAFQVAREIKKEKSKNEGGDVNT